MPRQLRVFLCHASQDKPAVWKLHRYLKQHGISPWLDQADLLPGQNWEVEIPKALYASDVILVCLSKNSVNKEGYVQKEIVFALDKAMEKPQGTIFIIPVKLEDCSVPQRLSRYQWVDYYRPDGRKRLLLGLNVRAKDLGEDVSPVILEDTRRVKPNSQLLISSEQIAIESIKAQLEENQREYNERLAREKKEREAAERATSEQAENEKVEREVAEQIAFSQAERELKEKTKRELNFEMPKAQTFPVVAKERASAATPAPKLNLLPLGIGVIVLLIVIFIGNYLIKTLDILQTIDPDISTSIANTATQVAASTNIASIAATNAKNTAVVLTQDALPTVALLPTFTPTPGIGSTKDGADGMILVFVPAGEFTMGSDTGSEEQPVHKVNVDAFWIDQTEVTNAMYAKCVEGGGCTTVPSSSRSYNRGSYYGNSEFNDYPVINVDWNQANVYCSWAGRRLPTEAEWEKAARGTDGRKYPWGEEISCTYANYYDGSKNCVGDTAPVSSYPDGASIYGALNMAGNVWEWVSSLYQDYPYVATDGREDLTASGSRVLRGGSWNNDGGSYVRSSYRNRNDPTFTSDFLGFRCSLSNP